MTCTFAITSRSPDFFFRKMLSARLRSANNKISCQEKAITVVTVGTSHLLSMHGSRVSSFTFSIQPRSRRSTNKPVIVPLTIYYRHGRASCAYSHVVKLLCSSLRRCIVIVIHSLRDNCSPSFSDYQLSSESS